MSSARPATVMFALVLSTALAYGQSSVDQERAQHLDAVITAEQSALAAYFGNRNPQAAKWLNQVIALHEKELARTIPGEPINLALKYDLLLAHGRLAIVYERLGQRTESSRNLERAFEYGKECMRPPFSAVSEVLPLIASVDQNYSRKR